MLNLRIILLQIIFLVSLSVEVFAQTNDVSDLSFLGREWEVTEYAPEYNGERDVYWIGTWKRVDNSKKFNATWKKDGKEVGSAVIYFESLDGDKIKLKREGAGYYTGTLIKNEVNNGTATWYLDEGWYWDAKIIK